MIDSKDDLDDEYMGGAPENKALIENQTEVGGVGLGSDVANVKARVVLLEVAKGNTITHACYVAGVSRGMHGHWIKDSEPYQAAFAEAEACAVEIWEDECRRRAFKGVDEPVYQKGMLVGHVRKFSDLLAIFMLKGARPEKYRDNYVAVQININLASEVQQARARVLKAEAGDAAPTPSSD